MFLITRCYYFMYKTSDYDVVYYFHSILRFFFSISILPRYPLESSQNDPPNFYIVYMHIIHVKTRRIFLFFHFNIKYDAWTSLSIVCRTSYEKYKKFIYPTKFLCKILPVLILPFSDPHLILSDLYTNMCNTPKLSVFICNTSILTIFRITPLCYCLYFFMKYCTYIFYEVLHAYFLSSIGSIFLESYTSFISSPIPWILKICRYYCRLRQN